MKVSQKHKQNDTRIKSNSREDSLIHENNHSNETQYTNAVQSRSSSFLVEQQIKQNLKALVQQIDVFKKLMISCIISSLYIEQYNYQQAHKILTDMQKTISKLQDMDRNNNGFKLRRQDSLDLAVIKVKMYTNFILIAVINLQVGSFQQHLNQALEFIAGYKERSYKKGFVGHQPSENANLNVNADNELQKSQLLQTMVMLFQLFLKGFSGFESFQQIQAETLIAQCQMENDECSDIRNFFYFSNLSFLKLLSTSDYQAAYKLQVHSYDFIESDIQNSKESQQPISLRQVVLKTVSLKKLLYLAEELKLPTEIIKKYKQKLNSTQALQSKYLEGLQETTIFRNYSEKIDLGFRLVSRLKQFEKEVIEPVIFTKNSKVQAFSEQSVQLGHQLKTWECKALKNKFLQLLASSSLESNEKAKENILMVVECLSTAIQRQKTIGYRSRVNQVDVTVEEMLLLETIGCLKQKQPLGSKNQKSQSFSLYESSISEYKSRLSILSQTLNQRLIRPLMEMVFQKLEEQEEPEIQVEIYHDDEDKDQKQLQKESHQSSSESEPSIYLEDVEFEVIDNNKGKKQEQKIQEKKSKKIDFAISQEKHQKQQRQSKQQKQQKQQKSYTSQKQYQHQKPKSNIPVQPSSYPLDAKDHSNSQLQYQDLNRAPKSPMKNIYLNGKNQVYMNYTELGSRVKLNQQKHHIPSKSQSELYKQTFNEPQKYQKYQMHSKKTHHHQQSVRKEEGAIQMPHQQSYVKYVGKKYPFEEKSTYGQGHFSSVQVKQDYQKDKILDKFRLEKTRNIDSKIVEKIEERSFEENSISKSRKKKSSLSPKIPKDSTINSRLNQHIKKHQLTYSPQSKVSGMKSRVTEGKDRLDGLSSYSAGLSPSQKSRSKYKQKVQKASAYPKSPNNASNLFHNKTIKFKEYMENLQKSGVNLNANVKQSQKPSNTHSKPKIESKSSHRRIATEANDLSQQNYEAYMTGMGSKSKVKDGNNSILEGFLTQPMVQRSKVMMGHSPSERGLSPLRKQRDMKENMIKPKRTDSELITFPQQSQMTKLPQKKLDINPRQGQTTQSVVQQTRPIQQNNALRSQLVNNQQLKLSKTSPSLVGMLSPDMIKDYILKMMKSHKAKLNHAIKLCENGQYVDKKHYSSDGGDERFLQLSTDHKCLQWAVSEGKLIEGHKTKYQLKNIKGVVYGQITATMQKPSNKQLEPFKCISFIFQKRTFDIYIPDEHDANFWLPGISYCISQARPQLNHPNYTTRIEKFIRKRDPPLQKDDYHANTVYYSLGRVLWKRTLLKLQHKYLNKSKKSSGYKNANAGAIIEFKKAMLSKEKQVQRMGSMLPPTGKQSKMSKQKSVSQNSRLKQN